MARKKGEAPPMLAVFEGGKGKPKPDETEIIFTPDGESSPDEEAETARQELRVKFEWLLQNCENVIVLGFNDSAIFEYASLDPDRLKVLGSLTDAVHAISMQGRQIILTDR